MSVSNHNPDILCPVTLLYLGLVLPGPGQHVVIVVSVGRLHLLQATRGQQQGSQGLLGVSPTQGLVDQADGEDLCETKTQQQRLLKNVSYSK